MENKRTYTIEINGIEQSINAVEALNAKLNELETKINALQNKTVNVTSNVNVQTPTSTTTDTSALREEDNLLKQIEQTEQRIADVRRNEYQELLHQKDILKEVKKEGESRFAEDNLVLKEYSNTMLGVKERLADLKKAMQTKEIGSEEFKELQKVVAQLNSSMKDATVSSQAMDNMLDTMEGIVALASTAKGIGALFGFDNNAIEQSIQKMVALQNVLQGIEKIRQQMNTGEGIGGLFAKGNAAIDKFAASLLKVDKSAAGASKSVKSLSTAMKALGGVAIAAAIIAITAAISKLNEKNEEFRKTQEKNNEVLKASEGAYIKAKIEMDGFIKKINQFNGTANEEKKLLDEVNTKYGTHYKHLKDAKDAKTGLNAIAPLYLENIRLEAEMYALAAQKAEDYVDAILLTQKQKELQGWLSGRTTWTIDAETLTGHTYEQQERALEKVNKQLAENKKRQDAVSEAMEKNSEKTAENVKKMKELGVTGKETTTNLKKGYSDVGKTINDLQMRLMDEGLNKRLMQLDEEKRQTLNKLNQNSRAYLEVERLYQELRLKEVKNYLKEFEKSIEESAKRIGEERLQINIDKIKSQISEIDLLMKEQEYAQPTIKTLVSSDEYEKILYGEKKLTQEQKKEIDQRLADAKHYLDTKEEYNELERANIEIEYQKELDIIRSYGKLEEGTLQESFAYRERAQRAYEAQSFENLKALLVDRRTLLTKEANKEKEAAVEAASGTYETQKESLEKQSKILKDGMLAISNQYGGDLSKMTKEDKESYDKMQADLLDVLEQLGDAWTNYTNKVENIDKNHSNKLKEIDQNTAESMSRIMENYFDTQLSNYRDFNSKLSDEVGKQPVYNSLGIVNLSASRKNYKEILDATKQTINQIKEEKNRLNEDGFITPEAYNATMLELTDLEKSTKEKSEQIQGDLKELGVKWWASIDQWIQQIGSTMGSILSSVSEIQSNHFDKMIDEQEKYIDKLQEMYDKQQDITQTYADAVTSIEDELSTARGDRRQQLIDNLNAEMAAQRASLAQEKKIEKEQEKAERKKAELEYDQAVAKKKMDEAQALINAAMAVSMAAVNHWPVPAIPMMAMATAVGAAQYAAVKSRHIPKPSYGEGGVIQGKSHREGGVPVLGGRAEVEGGEYITNKVTTAKNVDLLEYINTKRRKIKLEDLIDFYGGNSQVKKSISTVRTKFADGGMIPTLRNDINLSDRMLTAFEDYSNRPVQVAVVDIIDRTQQVNDVKVMAGLDA